jgi:hypothetical protein
VDVWKYQDLMGHVPSNIKDPPPPTMIGQQLVDCVGGKKCTLWSSKMENHLFVRGKSSTTRPFSIGYVTSPEGRGSHFSGARGNPGRMITCER